MPLKILAGGSQYQLAVFDTFDTDQFIGNLFYHQNRATNNQHFEAVMGIKMNMQRGNYLIMMGMLMIGQFIGKITHMMVIDERHRADGLLILSSATFLNERRPDQVANGLGTIHITLLFYQLIKILQKFFIQ